jgi:biotin transport system substrate-specific component
MLVGTLVIYLVGVPWLAVAAGQDLGWAIQRGFYPFVLGDLLKVVVAAGLLPVGWSLVRRRSSDH